MATNTPNYNFILPAVNDPTDEDLWGGYLNENWQGLDTLLKTATDSPTSVKTGAYTITTADRNSVIFADATSAGFTVSLPTASSAGNGFKVAIKKIDSTTNTVTIDGNGTEEIDGETTRNLSRQYDFLAIVCDGSNWFILAPLVPESSGTDGRFLGIDVIDTSQTWTKPTDVGAIHIFVCGAGGGPSQSGSNGADGTNTTAVFGSTTLIGGGGKGGRQASGGINGGGFGGTASGGNIANQTGGYGHNEGADGTGGNGYSGAGGSNRFAGGGSGGNTNGNAGGGGGSGPLQNSGGGGAGGIAESYLSPAPDSITISIGSGGSSNGASGGNGRVYIYKYSV